MKFARQKRLSSLFRNKLESCLFLSQLAQFKLFSNRKLLSIQAVVLLIDYNARAKNLF
jgi:hypothetical protein